MRAVILHYVGRKAPISDPYIKGESVSTYGPDLQMVSLRCCTVYAKDGKNSLELAAKCRNKQRDAPTGYAGA